MFFILLTLVVFLTALEKMGRSMMSWNMCGYKGDRLEIYFLILVFIYKFFLFIY